MAVNVKMGVDIGSFKQGIREGQQILKSLDAEMKVTEAEFKATGNAEKQMADKTRILTSQMNVQKGVIDQIQQAMKKMADAGIQPTDQAYQKLNLQLLNTQAAMMSTQAQLNSLSGSEQQAAGSADKLATSVGSIGKKLSLDQVISGIDKITGAMENALKTAVRFGEQIWDNIMESAQWGDDIATQAAMAQMSIDEYQRVVNVAATQGETSTSSLVKSWKKVKMNLTSDSAEVVSAFKELGITTTEWFQDESAGFLKAGTRAKDYMDVYWEIGEALMNMTDSAKQERLAQTLLGRSWQESIPMFLMGREAYEKALANQDVNTDETVQNLATLNDKIIQIEKQFATLKNELIGQLAPAFSEVADVISGILHELNVYLKSEDGQKLLAEMGNAISDLFEGLKGISAEDIVNGFKTGFDAVVDGLKWVVENKDLVIGALEGIIAGWGALKLVGAAADMLKLINGLQSLLGIGGGAATGTGATGAVATGAATWVSGLISGIGQSAFNMALYDSAGAFALAPYMFMDKTAAGQALQHGEGIDGAIEAGKKEIELAATQAAQNWSDYFTKQLPEAFETLGGLILDAAGQNKTGEIGTPYIDISNLNNEWNALFGGGNKENEPELPVRPELPEDAQQQLQNAMDSWNPMKIYVTPVIQEPQGSFIQGHANGLPWVPYDGYLAMLHRGERVLTASENRSYTYNSNNYFGNVNLNNGQDIDALCDSIDRHNRRQRSGYGS